MSKLTKYDVARMTETTSSLMYEADYRDHRVTGRFGFEVDQARVLYSIGDRKPGPVTAQFTSSRQRDKRKPSHKRLFGVLKPGR